jgi:hypothetical protein
MTHMNLDADNKLEKTRTSETMNDLKKRASQMTVTHRDTLVTWGPFMGTCIAIFYLFSDGDFSFLMTFSSIISLFSFLMVASKIENSKSCSGVSLRMIDCYLLITGARLCAIVPFEGYLPYDRSGDWLYQVIETAIFCVVGSIVFLCRKRYVDTYNSQSDTINHLYLIAPAAILALIFHPSLNGFWPADVAWVFALYLESFAALPQLFMFQKEGHVRPWTAHFLAAQALSKLTSFLFWFSSYGELSDRDAGHKALVGYWVLAMQLLQLLVMGDFIYQYLNCVRKGVPVAQMLSSEAV